MNQLGWLLKKRRESLGWSMTQVAQKAKSLLRELYRDDQEELIP